MSLKCVLLACLIVISLVNCQDEVKFPNDFPYKGKTYSGYLELDNGKTLHYLYNPMEIEPEKNPLVLWLNGGPGCSSMLGWSQENGPVIVDELGKYALNENSWHKAANMLYLESPAGVGYSYASKPEDEASDDIKSAQDNLTALLKFFGKYPSLKTNDFYITGESYAGIYVPSLASLVIDYNEKSSPADRINLKGIAVGNGVTDWRVDTRNAFYDFAWMHALYSIETRKQYVSTCVTQVDAVKCKAVKDEIDSLFEGINIYDIYRECYYDPKESLGLSETSPKPKIYNYTPWLKWNEENNKQKFPNKLRKLIDPSVGTTPPCVDSRVNGFFNNQSIRTALNIKGDKKWEMCSDNVANLYKADFQKGSLYLYPKLIINKIRILKYSGDTDGAVPTNGTLTWIHNLGLPVIDRWRKWLYNGQVAGYTEKYQGLTFVSIKGVGHMVPQWKRPEALQMFRRFLKNEDY